MEDIGIPGQKGAHEKILEIVIDRDEITWQSIIYDLIKSEQIDPWDVNISLLSQHYIERIKRIKELDLRLSGKVLLAAAMLLKIKSNRLVGEDLDMLDSLMSGSPEEDGAFEELGMWEQKPKQDIPGLIPRTPQPRKRKVSIYDLINALEKALEVKERKVLRSIPPMSIEIPTKTRDVGEVIKGVYLKIKGFFLRNTGQGLTFSQLVPSDSKEDKIFTFIPLLHLTTQRKIDLEQKEHFGEIEVMLTKTKQEVEQEIGQ